MTLPNQNYALDDPFPRSQFPQSAADAYYSETGVFPSYIFQGPSLDAVLGDVTLVPTGGALVDQPVADVLTLADSPPNRFTDNSMLTHAYFPGVDSIVAPANDSINMGTGSVLIDLTCRFIIPISGIADIWGNFTAGSQTGIELRTDTSGNLLANVGGQAASLMSQFSNGTGGNGLWHRIVLLINRDEGQSGTLTLATIKASTAAIGGVPSGLLNDDRPISIGKGRGIAAFMLSMMSMVISTGVQLDGRSAKDIATSIAPLQFWSPTFTRVTESVAR